MELGKEPTTARRIGACVAALVILVPAVGAGMAAASSSILVGTNKNAIDKLDSLGVKPDIATMWVGPWSNKNWANVDNELNHMKSKGVAPMIQWYYWGDDISEHCLENGCWSSLHKAQKTRYEWNSVAVKLAKSIRTVYGDRPVYVVLETEFNKGQMGKYEPLDGYLAHQADIFRDHAPNARLILGFGNWGWSNYKNFDRAIAKVDYLGTQELGGSTRDSKETYLAGPTRLESAANHLWTNFKKPVFITDAGWSSYPEPAYAGYQEQVVRGLFAKSDSLYDNGVRAIVTRSIYDTPTMSTANYYGVAERYWGMIRADGSWKPSMDDYVNGVKKMRAASGGTTPTPTAPSTGSGNVPGALEGESADWASVGKAVYDSKASNGRAWLLWANGYTKQAVTAKETGTYAFTVHARGTPAYGEWPVMVMTLDHQEVGRWVVRTSSEYWSYTVDVPLTAGEKKAMRVYFVNDRYDPSNGEDRNLYVDVVRVSAGSASGGATSGRIEAEGFSNRATGGRFSDSKASGGAGWNIWSTGAIHDSIKLSESGKYALTIRAKGSFAGDAFPQMVLEVDGKVVGRWDVTTDGPYYTYTVRPTLAAGEHDVSVKFVNDYFDKASGKDRNLHVDSVEFTREG